jgi:hypothetical protein
MKIQHEINNTVHIFDYNPEQEIVETEYYFDYENAERTGRSEDSPKGSGYNMTYEYAGTQIPYQMVYVLCPICGTKCFIRRIDNINLPRVPSNQWKGVGEW